MWGRGMGASLQVRRISGADVLAYYALRMRSIKELPHAAEPTVARELDGGAGGLANMLAYYNARGTRVWGAFDENLLVGAVGLSRGLAEPDGGSGRLWGVYVLPRYRGTPVSRLLMEAVFACCEEWRITYITVRFAKANIRGLQFLQRWGFDETRRDEPDDSTIQMHREIQCTRL
jgi:GNAT superfamily N-acetyltransferase